MPLRPHRCRTDPGYTDNLLQSLPTEAEAQEASSTGQAQASVAAHAGFECSLQNGNACMGLPPCHPPRSAAAQVPSLCGRHASMLT